MSNSIADLAVSGALEMYFDLGIDAIPLKAGEKEPFQRSWQKRLPFLLWKNAPNDANIGVRSGGIAKIRRLMSVKPAEQVNIVAPNGKQVNVAVI